MTGNRFVRRNHGTGHSYWLGDRKVPGVTTILSEGVPKPALVGWAAGSVADYVVDRLREDHGHILADDLVQAVRDTSKYPIPSGLPRVKLAQALRFAPNNARNAAGARGSDIHDLALQLAQTGQADIPDHLLGHVDAYLDWRRHWQPQLELVEHSVLNKTAFYAGTFDLWALLLGDNGRCLVCGNDGCEGRCLIDWKTSGSGIFGETALQLTAYHHAETMLGRDGDEQPMVGVDHCLGVWLRADRTHETYELAAGPDVFRLFRYVYEVAKAVGDPKKLFGSDDDAPIRTFKSAPLAPLTEVAS